MLAALLALGFLAACGGSPEQQAGAAQSSEASDHNADDVAFARKMISHDEQAVEMAQMVPTNTSSQQMVALANQIIATQLPEIQAFRTFLVQWQGAEGNDSSHDPHGAPMPGMIDQATLDKLQQLRGAEFDRLWLTSMIDHHRAAIAMAQDELAHGRHPDVLYLARTTIANQQAEIDQMKQVLGG